MTEDNPLEGLREFICFPGDGELTRAVWLKTVATRIEIALECGTYRGGPHWHPSDVARRPDDLMDEMRQTDAKNREVLDLLKRPICR